MQTVYPSAGWVLLSAIEQSEKTEGGIIKPPSVLDRERSTEGDSAPTFRVITIPADTCVGMTKDDENYAYPGEGSEVLVSSRLPGLVLKFGRDEYLVHLTAIIAMVDRLDDDTN